MRKVAILTSGGDAPGMNSAVYSFSHLAIKKGYEVLYINDGYQGLIEEKYININLENLRKEVYSSGTIIGASRSMGFKNSPEKRIKGVEWLKKQGVESLVILGGNGTQEGAVTISKLGLPVILLPATIDNDINYTNYTIGFFSAIEEIGKAIKKIWMTTESHSTISIIETMGWGHSDLAVYVSCSSPLVDFVISYENIPSVKEIKEKIRFLKKKGRRGIIIVVAEKILGFNLPKIEDLIIDLSETFGLEARQCVLSYIQMGAAPTSWERFVADSFGREAFRIFETKTWDCAIGFNGFSFYTTPIFEIDCGPKKGRFDLIDYKNNFFF